MMRKTTTLALVAAMGLSGCLRDGGFFRRGEPEPAPAYEPPDDGTPSGYGLQEVTWSSLEGELGGHALALADVRGTASSDYGTTIELETTEGGTWVLFRLSLDENLYGDVPSGTVLSSEGEYVDLMGCTGPSPGSFDYDGYASRVEVAVFDGAEPNTRQLEITATFDEYGSSRQVDASVVLDLGATTPDAPPPSGGYTYSERATTWIALETDLGPTDVSLSSVEGRTWSDGFQSRIELDTLEGGRWTMFALSLEGDVGDLEPGSTVQGDLLGCVGPSRGSYDFDGTTDAQLEVLEGDSPYERIGHLTATFNTSWGLQTVDATFRYEVF